MNDELLEKKQYIDRIDSSLVSLINLTEMTRLKNINIKTSFADEFFNKIQNYTILGQTN